MTQSVFASRTLRVFSAACLIVALIFSALPVPRAYAATLTVSDCSAPSGAAGRLVEQITAAADGDTINFSCSGTITLTSMINLTKDLTFDGVGQNVTISGGNAVSVFFMTNYGYLTLKNLTIANGFSGGDGGAINNMWANVTLNIINTTFSNNRASNDGGAIRLANAILNVSNSAFVNNTASTATNGGGSIFFTDSQSAVISNSTFSGNSTSANGGAIWFGTFSAGTLTIINSSFSGNTATGNGGAIHKELGATTLINTIVANNAGNGNCSGVITNGGNNLQFGGTVANSCGATITTPTSDPFGGNALANNGGTTQTIALPVGSAAIDAGNTATCAGSPVSGVDQRGVARPQGAGCDIGAYESDATPPSVVVTSLQSAYSVGPASFIINFSEKLNDPVGNTNINDVSNPANYLLVEKGSNGAADTVSCAGGVKTDDANIPIASVSYNDALFMVTVNFASALPNGKYRLHICGTTSIADIALNKLNSGLSDYVFDFTVGAISTTGDGGSGRGGGRLPRTGFAPNVTTVLPPQPASMAYANMGDLWLEIPSQKIKTNIVGVPQSKNGWEAAWLGANVGWLNGTAYPTWNGNSVLTGHVYNADGLPGPFANIKSLKSDEQIIVHLQGQNYTFAVRNSRLVRPEVTAFALQSLKGNSFLTLITCQGYTGKSDVYSYSRVVRAELIGVDAK